MSATLTMKTMKMEKMTFKSSAAIEDTCGKCRVLT